MTTKVTKVKLVETGHYTTAGKENIINKALNEILDDKAHNNEIDKIEFAPSDKIVLIQYHYEIRNRNSKEKEWYDYD